MGAQVSSCQSVPPVLAVRPPNPQTPVPRAGIAQGLDWSRHHLKMVLAGEVFSEEWRDLMVKR